MKMFLVMAMRRPSFDVAVVEPHKAFLDALSAAGQLHLTGGFSDGSGGAYILKNVADLETAKAIVARDPLAIHGSSELTIHEWNTR
ncbi:YciI family protein [Stenotrophomonas sp. SY1]|jgi:uncharacterized protein YciI|uniref:YciI family protein n=1 Tax=Stenotrophomonas sp. SY1 TaxID=477235 RepID=UPI001E6071D1|nr:YciI family protein [Stenotrophomonas sp. SY1]MCD9086747.1 YciI family protein [Stenotrophomonas sp. SY1]